MEHLPRTPLVLGETQAPWEGAGWTLGGGTRGQQLWDRGPLPLLSRPFACAPVSRPEPHRLGPFDLNSPPGRSTLCMRRGAFTSTILLTPGRGYSGPAPLTLGLGAWGATCSSLELFLASPPPALASLGSGVFSQLCQPSWLLSLGAEEGAPQPLLPPPEVGAEGWRLGGGELRAVSNKRGALWPWGGTCNVHLLRGSFSFLNLRIPRVPEEKTSRALELCHHLLPSPGSATRGQRRR